jgi:DNA-binding FrmR family transcriptional regulator
MVSKGEYCIDILHQSSAVKEALSGVEDLILENHLSTHVIEQIKAGKSKKSTREILEIYKLSKKK